MNLYLCIFLIIVLTLIDCFLHLSESAVTAANISRIKQLEDDGDKKAEKLAGLRSGQKPFFIAVVRTIGRSVPFVYSAFQFRHMDISIPVSGNYSACGTLSARKTPIGQR